MDFAFQWKRSERMVVRGKATWTVQDGILIGEGGMGHIYTDAQHVLILRQRGCSVSPGPTATADFISGPIHRQIILMHFPWL